MSLNVIANRSKCILSAKGNFNNSLKFSTPAADNKSKIISIKSQYFPRTN
jgi:hypothetical protein